MKRMSAVAFGAALGVLAVVSSSHAAPRSCGTHWTGWVDEANPAKNPCPANCTRGERLRERTHKQGGKTQYDVQYQCYVADAGAPASPAGAARPATAPQGPAAAGTAAATGAALMTASPAEPGAPQGAWIGWDQLLNPKSRTPGDTDWEPGLRAVATVVRESPALQDLGGFYPQIQALVSTKREPVPYARLTLTAWPPDAVEPDPAAKGGDGVYRVKPNYLHKPEGLSLRLNWLPSEPQALGFAAPEWARDAAGAFFPLPRSERSIAGYPVIGGNLIVTAAGKAPVFVPVSQERAYTAAIAAARAQAKDTGAGQGAGNEALAHWNSAEMKNIRRKMIEEAGAHHKDPSRAAAARKKAEEDDREQERQLRAAAGGGAAGGPGAQAAQKTAAELEAKLKAMTPEQRRAPAHVKAAPDSILADQPVPAGTPDALPLVEFNRSFFDGRLPAYTLQLMIMPAARNVDELKRHGKSLQERVVTAATEQTDWRKIGALMK